MIIRYECKYLLGEEFRIEKLLCDKDYELSNYKISSNSNELLVPKLRTGRPALNIRTEKGLWYITYNFMALGIISLGYFGLALLLHFSGNQYGIVAFGGLLLTTSLFFFYGKHKASKIDKQFRELEAKRRTLEGAVIHPHRK